MNKFFLGDDSNHGARSPVISVEGRKLLQLVITVVMLGFTFSVYYHYILSSYLGHEGYWERTFLFNPQDKFNDFYNIYFATENLNPYSSPVSVYFPFTFIPVYLLTFLKANIAFALFTGGFVVFFCSWLWWNLRSDDLHQSLTGVFVFTCMSYPVLFLVDRGNLECLLFICLALFIHYYQKGDDLKCVSFLSFAIAMKLYPAVFGVLFLADRKYRNLLLTILCVVSLTLVSAWVFENGMVASYQGLVHNLQFFKQQYLGNYQGLQHNNSLYSLYSLLTEQPLFPGEKFIWLYPYVAISIFAAITLYVVCFESVLWKKATLLVFSILLLPQLSYDYKLVHLFIPIVLFIRHVTSRKRIDYGYALLFGLLLIPKDYVSLNADISSNVVLNPLIMLTIGVMIVVERCRKTIR